jgi:hypothetical protein
MNAEKVRDLLRQLENGIGQQGVALRCDCKNLETVFVFADADGTVRVTDDHRTFQYLNDGSDSTYVPVERFDWAAAAQICQELRVELKSAVSNDYPIIECLPKPRELVSEVVERVAAAIDRIFALAMRPDLK